MDSLLLDQNDNSPDYESPGVPAEWQVGKEWAVIMYQVLMDLGMTAQLARFHVKIWQKTKPGKLKYITDPELAQAYDGFAASGTRRNYISVLRKKLKAWNSGEYESGRRHYSFISIQDNEFNPKTKRYNPTAYEFSKDFHELIYSIVTRTRLHRLYSENWERAARETIAAMLKANDDLAFGYYRERKQKRPRSLDAIIGTLMLNWTRTTRQLAAALTVIGIENVKAEMQAIFDANVKDATDVPISLKNYHEDLIKPAPEMPPGEIYFGPVERKNVDISLLYDKILQYVQDRENAKFENAAPVYVRPKYDRNISERSTTNVGPAGKDSDGQNVGHMQPMDIRPTDELGKALSTKPAVDSARHRFLAGNKARE